MAKRATVGRPKVHIQPQVRLNLWMGDEDRELLRAAAWNAGPGVSHASMIARAVREHVDGLPASDRRRVLDAVQDAMRRRKKG